MLEMPQNWDKIQKVTFENQKKPLSMCYLPYINHMCFGGEINLRRFSILVVGEGLESESYQEQSDSVRVLPFSSHLEKELEALESGFDVIHVPTLLKYVTDWSNWLERLTSKLSDRGVLIFTIPSLYGNQGHQQMNTLLDLIDQEASLETKKAMARKISNVLDSNHPISLLEGENAADCGLFSQTSASVQQLSHILESLGFADYRFAYKMGVEQKYDLSHVSKQPLPEELVCLNEAEAQTVSEISAMHLKEHGVMAMKKPLPDQLSTQVTPRFWREAIRLDLDNLYQSMQQNKGRAIRLEDGSSVMNISVTDESLFLFKVIQEGQSNIEKIILDLQSTFQLSEEKSLEIWWEFYASFEAGQWILLGEGK